MGDTRLGGGSTNSLNNILELTWVRADQALCFPPLIQKRCEPIPPDNGGLVLFLCTKAALLMFPIISGDNGWLIAGLFSLPPIRRLGPALSPFLHLGVINAGQGSEDRVTMSHGHLHMNLHNVGVQKTVQGS